ncbi:hypothetical protein DF3PB_550015 [uncultured Defluviicoccus sp.]|uniref:Uncharacterized protein n=1 Tax=metagenome TaxID=256318 RepID=A0A380TJY2_9ZZZZ|nr:hypothetical protein DF3PB_550015 [uncultured Defluviicoccus sp.]
MRGALLTLGEIGSARHSEMDCIYTHRVRINKYRVDGFLSFAGDATQRGRIVLGATGCRDETCT